MKIRSDSITGGGIREPKQSMIRKLMSIVPIKITKQPAKATVITIINTAIIHTDGKLTSSLSRQRRNKQKTKPSWTPTARREKLERLIDVVASRNRKIRLNN